MEHPIQSVFAKLSGAEWIPVTAARVLTGVFSSRVRLYSKRWRGSWI
jgi:hypothetical protein